jgi:hypothetical protein
LLNATLRNVSELILGLLAVWKGPAMYPLIKASLAGSNELYAKVVDELS